MTTRRDFLRTAGLGAAALAFGPRANGEDRMTDRPNILWITSEDNGRFLGCYGDRSAETPNLDRMAEEGILYENAYSNAPVCAPSRFTIITGVYACSAGTQHMRSGNPIPPEVRFFTEFLREAGYYCSNRRKEDYNTQKPPGSWDDSSGEATWRNRGEGQPFFSVVNLTVSHESKVHQPEPTVHDPGKMILPPYHPDTAELRHDWAQYYDKVTELDRQIGGVLKQLEDDGLAEDTIVFYYSDHAGVLPRSKRFLYDSGIHVPFILRFPEKYRHLAPGEPGSRTDRMVSFVDLAPTILSLAGIPVPEYMQGRAFLGEQAGPGQEYIFAFRDRMDERYDLSRAVRDGRYKYIRNYLPHIPHGHYLYYLWKMPATRAWEREYKAGNLNDTQRRFFEPKAPEELYDVENDPHEVRNLAGDPAHAETLDRMRGALRERILALRDTGFLPEGEMIIRSEGSTPYEMARVPEIYDLESVLRAAEIASKGDPASLPRLQDFMRDKDSTVRYWGVTGCLILGEDSAAARGNLESLTADPSPNVRIAVAEALAGLGEPEGATGVLREVLEHPIEEVRLHAANVVDRMDDGARPLLPRMRELAGSDLKYVQRVMEKAVADLDAAE